MRSDIWSFALALHPAPFDPEGCLLQKHFEPNLRLDPRDINTVAAGTNWKSKEREINYAEALY